jgi:two-component system NtrC family sensor kinase
MRTGTVVKEAPRVVPRREPVHVAGGCECDAQEALRESEERHRRLVEHSPDIAYIYSDRRGALYWSPRVQEVLGISPDELKEQPYLWHDAIHPDDLPRVDEAIASREMGKHAEIEYRIRDRNGEWHWFRDRFVDKRRVGDEVLIEGVATDITSRKQAERQLRQYAEEQAALYAVAAEASAHLAPQTMLSSVLDLVIPLMACDAGWVTLPGGTLDDPPRLLASRGVSASFVTAEGSEPLRACPICCTMLATESSEPAWAVISDCPRLPQGVLRDLNLHRHVIVPLSAAGRVLGFLHLAWRAARSEVATNERLLAAVGRQIGLALRNAQLYQEARQVDRLRSINDLATGLISVSCMDQDTVLRQILEPTCRALDAPAGAIILNDPRSEGLFLALALTDQGIQHQVKRFLPDQGIAGWVADHGEAVALRDAQRDPRFSEEVDGALGVAVHSLLCAPIKHLERSIGAIEILNKRGGQFDEEDLSLLVSVASIAAVALENARLYHDLRQEAAEHEETEAKFIQAAKISALGRLAASVAHEISNPLQAVQGYLSLAEERLERARSQDRVQQYLRIASEEIERISDLVARVREFYRPTRRGFWPTDVHVVLERVLDLSRRRLEQSGVTVECGWRSSPPAPLPHVEANADQLVQVFLNLVINAIEAMPDGGTLHVSAVEDRLPDDGRPAVRVEFADTGNGMDAVTLDRLFEPFFTTKEDGSGLGLSVSYGIIRSHRGEIWATSEEGQGATFAVRLPVEQPPDT